tara:strand:- start:25 stop:252 length:228 start_codon:yes stop_codon:yes gene_type:complete
MRTTKEKAIELVDRFLALKKINPNAITRPYNWQEAKQCALICVDETLESLWNVGHSDVNDQIEYWQEVKQEIKII